MKQKKMIGLMIVVVIVAAGGSFYGGMQYANNQRASSVSAQFGQNGQMPGGRGQNRAMEQGRQQGGPVGRFGAGGGMVSGQITAKDDKSFTIKAQDGSFRIVFYSDQTTVGKSNKAAISDLAMGQNVVVSGKPSPDGSVSAQDVQIKAAE